MATIRPQGKGGYSRVHVTIVAAMGTRHLSVLQIMEGETVKVNGGKQGKHIWETEWDPTLLGQPSRNELRQSGG